MHDNATLATFSTNDVEASERFYRDVLGATTRRNDDMFDIEFPSGARGFCYFKDDHSAPGNTVLTFFVDDVAALATELAGAGFPPEKLPYTGDDGIMRAGEGEFEGMPATFWTRDPAGNWLAFIEGNGRDWN